MMSQGFLFPRDDSRFPDKSSCMTTLKPFIEILSGTVLRSWDTWKDVPSEHRVVQEGSTSGMWMYRATQHFSKGFFSGSPGVKFLNLPFFAIEIGGQACIRFRKLNQDFLAQRTSDMSKRYYNQGAIEGLDGDVDRLTCGYVLDRSGEDVKYIAITCQDADRIVWSTNIYSMFGVAQGSVVSGQSLPDLPDIGFAEDDFGDSGEDDDSDEDGPFAKEA